MSVKTAIEKLDELFRGASNSVEVPVGCLREILLCLKADDDAEEINYQRVKEGLIEMERRIGIIENQLFEQKKAHWLGEKEPSHEEGKTDDRNCSLPIGIDCIHKDITCDECIEFRKPSPEKQDEPCKHDINWVEINGERTGVCRKCDTVFDRRMKVLGIAGQYAEKQAVCCPFCLKDLDKCICKQPAKVEQTPIDAIQLANAMPLDWRNWSLVDLCHEAIKKLHPSSKVLIDRKVAEEWIRSAKFAGFNEDEEMLRELRKALEWK